MRTFLRVLRVMSFFSLLLGGQFTLTAMAQGDLGRVLDYNQGLIRENHLRGDIANLQSELHQLIFHQQYGYGYYGNDGYFYGTDQFGRGSRGRVRISPAEVGIGGAIIGGAVGGWKGAAIGGVGGYFATKAVQAVVQHGRNKKEQKQAEAMAAQAEAEAQASLEKKFVWNDFESVPATAFYQNHNGSQFVKVGPGQRIEIFILPGTEVGFMVEGLQTPDGRVVNMELRYGNGKQKLPANSGWRVFNPKLGGY